MTFKLNPRHLRLFALFVAGLLLVPYLPLYVERTFMRLFLVRGAAGDTAEWGWALRTLAGFWSDYGYMTTEQRPRLWLCVNLALAVCYALLIALAADRLLVRISGFKSRRS